jgi:aminopeptidase N
MSRILKLTTLLLIVLTSASYAQFDFIWNKKFTKADTLRGTLSPLRSCYDVLFYDLDIRVDIANKSISGSNTIKFLVKSDFQQLQIDLFENMKIEKIEYNGQQLSYTRQFDAVFVDFPVQVKKESVQFLKIFYSGKPQSAKRPPWDGGFTWDKDPDGNPWVGVSCQGTGASLWWPCKDHQSDEPNEMLIRVTVPPGLMDVSNGRLKRAMSLPDGWTKYEWYVSYPINTYNVTVNIANYKTFSETYKHPDFKDTLTLDYFVLGANCEKAEKQFKQVKPMMECFYNMLGEYPFVRDGYKLVETPYLGMEHQSCIAYGNKYKNGYLGYNRSGTSYEFDYIIIHETAHEWWGNNVTTKDIADMWIHEGFGTYSEALYIECLYGHEAYLEYINAEKRLVMNDEPLTGQYGLNNEGSGDMYPKGALIVHTIRSIIDDDKKFMEIIKGIQSTFKLKTVDSKEIEKYIAEKSGIDFSDFFDLYLHSADIPKLSVELEEGDFNDLKITYRYTLNGASAFKQEEYQAKQTFFKMPVKVTLQKDVFSFLTPTTEWQSLILNDMKANDFKVATDLFYIDKEFIFVDENGAFRGE